MTANKEFLSETPSINFSHPLIETKIKELREKSDSQIDYIKNAYEFVRDEIPHSWDVKAKVVSKNAAEVLENGIKIYRLRMKREKLFLKWGNS